MTHKKFLIILDLSKFLPKSVTLPKNFAAINSTVSDHVIAANPLGRGVHSILGAKYSGYQITGIQQRPANCHLLEIQLPGVTLQRRKNNTAKEAAKGIDYS